MSRVADLLRARRAQQVAHMEGKPVDAEAVTTTDAAILDVQRCAAAKVKGRGPRPKQGDLNISKHAWERMSHRRLTAKKVRAIWTFGESIPLWAPNQTAYHMTRRAIDDAPKRIAELLSRHRGTAIIVASDNGRNTVVTVLADGEETRFS